MTEYINEKVTRIEYLKKLASNLQISSFKMYLLYFIICTSNT
jgi:hypothetical protein